MGIQERKAREKRRRALDILEAARRSFESKGFLSTTLQDVAQEAEVSVGLLYRYFKSKEDIFASLALEGAERFDHDLARILENAKPADPTEDILIAISEKFLGFYGPYGEYFDFLLFSWKGLNKKVEIRAFTLTKLMSLTLFSMDRMKDFILESGRFRVADEDDALKKVFLFWSLILGCHKIFDGSGRAHLLAFERGDLTRSMIRDVLQGMAKP